MSDRLYRCAECLDIGYTHHTPPKVLSQQTGKPIPSGGATTARFCMACDRGLIAESGFWASKLKPARGERTAKDEIIKAFALRTRDHPRGLELRDRVHALAGKSSEDDGRD